MTAPTAASIEELKSAVLAEIDRIAPVLVDVSRQLHARPELAFEEHFAHELLTATLADAGLRPERGAFDVPTAFVARAGSAGPTIGVLCEYDALPEIGHACGHNVIAAAGLGAGLAAAAVAERAGGRVAIYGTPAEEGGGGKVAMARNGAFAELDAAMMVHPADADLTRIDAIAVQQLTVTYSGKAAHAAAAPQEGRNALDAAVLGYQAVAALRQHITPQERIHGVFTNGGDKPNIVPAKAATHWYIRSPTIASLQPLKARVLAALESGAMATGCTVTSAWQELVLRRHGRQRRPARRLRRQRPSPRPGRRRPTGRRDRSGRLDRHGQRQLSRPLDPPDDPGRPRRNADPHRRVRRIRRR